MTARERDGDIPATSSRTANMSVAPTNDNLQPNFPPFVLLLLSGDFTRGENRKQRESVWAIPDFDKQPPRGEGRSKESGNKRRDGGGGCHTCASASRFNFAQDVLTKVIALSYG